MTRWYESPESFIPYLEGGGGGKRGVIFSLARTVWGGGGGGGGGGRKMVGEEFLLQYFSFFTPSLGGGEGMKGRGWGRTSRGPFGVITFPTARDSHLRFEGEKGGGEKERGKPSRRKNSTGRKSITTSMFPSFFARGEGKEKEGRGEGEGGKKKARRERRSFRHLSFSCLPRGKRGEKRKRKRTGEWFVRRRTTHLFSRKRKRKGKKRGGRGNGSKRWTHHPHETSWAITRCFLRPVRRRKRKGRKGRGPRGKGTAHTSTARIPPWEGEGGGEKRKERI